MRPIHLLTVLGVLAHPVAAQDWGDPVARDAAASPR